MIRRYLGLSGQKGSRTHCSTAGSTVKARRRGHREGVPMRAWVPKTCTHTRVP